MRKNDYVLNVSNGELKKYDNVECEMTPTYGDVFVVEQSDCNHIWINNKMYEKTGFRLIPLKTLNKIHTFKNYPYLLRKTVRVYHKLRSSALNAMAYSDFLSGWKNPASNQLMCDGQFGGKEIDTILSIWEMG